MRYFTNDNVLELYYNRDQWWYAAYLNKMWLWFAGIWIEVNHNERIIEDFRETNRLEMLLDNIPEVSEGEECSLKMR